MPPPLTRVGATPPPALVLYRTPCLGSLQSAGLLLFCGLIQFTAPSVPAPIASPCSPTPCWLWGILPQWGALPLKAVAGPMCWTAGPMWKWWWGWGAEAVYGVPAMEHGQQAEAGQALQPDRRGEPVQPRGQGWTGGWQAEGAATPPQPPSTTSLPPILFAAFFSVFYRCLSQGKRTRDEKFCAVFDIK